jgi:transposase-like protein
MSPINKSCPFCLSQRVSTLTRTLTGTRMFTEFRCEGCGHTWGEETHSQQAAHLSPPHKRKESA